MNRTFCRGFALLAFVALNSDIARAQKADEDGPSRSQLFSLFVRAPAEADLGILGSALPFSFRFPLHVRDDSVFGIDVSHHNEDFCNCQIDWNVVSNQKVAFAYMKATQGALFRDNKFISNWNTVGKLSTIHRGAYHFLSARNDPLDQAKNFLSVVGTLDSKDMPPCLDIEWDMATVDGQMRDAWADLSSDEIVARALKWLAAVEEATGRIPVIYTSNAWWKGRIKDDKMPLFERYQIWIADYSVKGLGEEKPNVPNGRAWAMWQFTEKGLLDQGLPGNVDANIFKGTLDEFRQRFGIVMTSTMPPADGSINAPTNSPMNTPANSPSNPSTPAAPPSNPKSGSTSPNSPPTQSASLSASGNANATPTASSAKTRSKPRKVNKTSDDDSLGFSLRGGRNIPVE